MSFSFVGQRTPHQKLGMLMGEVARMGDKRHDPTLEHMTEIAREFDVKAYSGGWVNLQNWADLNVAPSVVSAFTTTTALLNPAPRPFVPANSVNIGTRFRLRCWGSLTNTGAYSFTIGMAWNGTGGTPIIASAAQTPATGPLPFWFEAEATVLQIGAASTASIIAQGMAWGVNATATTTVLVPATAPTALSSTFATTAAWNLTANGTWATSQAGITCYGHTVEQLN
jgi:hypothetical protein